MYNILSIDKEIKVYNSELKRFIGNRFNFKYKTVLQKEFWIERGHINSEEMVKNSRSAPNILNYWLKRQLPIQREWRGLFLIRQ